MSAKVAQILECLNEMAPFSLAEPWDNAGLLAGNMDAKVDKVLCALDLSEAVLNEAVAQDVQLIVTHHPILFTGRKNLCENDPEGKLLCALVRSRIALIAMHTNYDNAAPGVNDALAAQLRLENVAILDNGMRIGDCQACTLSEFAVHVENCLGGPVRRYGDPCRIIRRVAVLGGAGEDFACQALSAGAEVYLTGEMAYHKALDAAASGLCILEAGHAATEKPGISALCRGLQIATDAVQYKIRVLDSKAELFL